ncbi:MAG: tyrosine--tRNA ligase [Patescibacteria group bacterium]
MKTIIDPKKIDEVLTRGVEEIIEKESLVKKLKSGKQLRIKFGIDPTAPDIHLGHSAPLRKLKQFQELGHKIVLIIGDFTATIGDPSGRSETRKPLGKKEVADNFKKYLIQAGKIINIAKTEIHYNSEWFLKEGVVRLLELSRAGSIQQVLRRADFKKRIDEGKDISLLEILYPLFQGYDSVKVKADAEVGGIDQKFNLLMGRRTQRFYKMPEQDIILVPLLEGVDGVKKMSKSYGNYIAVEDAPNDMFGKIMQLPDNLIVKYFLLCTDKTESEIQKIKTDMDRGELNPRDAKAKLAYEIVKIYHGEKTAAAAEKEFAKIFQEKELPTEMPKIKLAEKETDVLELLTKTKLASSKSEAKRLIEQKGIKINGEVQNDWRKIVSVRKGTVIQSGKRKFVKII